MGNGVLDALVVGAGFGGMGAAIELKRLGLSNLVILEREDDLGGTWYVNHYPGLAVDIPSVTYSYSFEPNPYWTRLFAPGSELKCYADHVADKYDLRRHMHFRAAVRAAHWNECDQFWEVHTADSQTFRARYLITATGYLSQPHLPDIAGIESFAGKILHTADWNDSFDAHSRRVAVIGTGATAVQLVPEIALHAADLIVFQRTPIWVLPKIDGPVPRLIQRLFATLPVVQKILRLLNASMLELLMITAVLHYRRANILNRTAEAIGRVHLRLQVHDSCTRRALTPAYSFGCKRPTFSNAYLRTFNKPTVHIETESISHIDPEAVITTAGRRHEVDTLILATGFNLWDTNFPAFEICGRNGRNLGNWWRSNRFQAYQGITIPYFPNLFYLASPYSYSGLCYFTTIESQMKHMRRLIQHMEQARASVFEVTEQANDEFLTRVTDLLTESVFYLGTCSGSRTYYINQHGEAAILRPTSTINAYREASSFPLASYQLT